MVISTRKIIVRLIVLLCDYMYIRYVCASRKNNASMYVASLLKTSTGGPKSGTLCLYALTSSYVDRFSKFFHCQNQKNICNKTVTKDPTTPQVCCYTILWNVNVLKATIENKTTSITTHFKSASSSSKADTLNIWCKNCRVRQLLLVIIS